MTRGKVGYVDVGSLINPVDALSRSLSGLSDMYGRQAAVEQENKRHMENQERLAANEAESKRRFDAQFKLQTDQIADKKHQDNVLKNFLGGYSRKSAVENYLKSDTELAKAIEDEKTISRDILSRNLISSLSLGPNGNVKYLSGLDEDETPVQVTDAELDKITFKTVEDLYKKGQVTEKDYKKLLGDISAKETEIDDNVVSRLPIYQKAEFSNIVRELTAKGVDIERSLKVAESLVAGYDNKDVLTKQALDAQKYEASRNKEAADIAYRIFKAKGGSGKYNKAAFKIDTEKYVSEADIMKYVESDLYDKDELVEYWKAAVKADVNPNVAKMALGDFVEDGIFGKNVKADIATFIAAAQKLETLASGNYNNSGNRDDLIQSLIPKSAAYRDPIEANRMAFLGGLKLLRATKSHRAPMTLGPDVLPKPNTETSTITENTFRNLSDEEKLAFHNKVQNNNYSNAQTANKINLLMGNNQFVTQRFQPGSSPFERLTTYRENFHSKNNESTRKAAEEVQSEMRKDYLRKNVESNALAAVEKGVPFEKLTADEQEAILNYNARLKTALANKSRPIPTN